MIIYLGIECNTHSSYIVANCCTSSWPKNWVGGGVNKRQNYAASNNDPYITASHQAVLIHISVKVFCLVWAVM